jgi:uncharacterized membrane protein YqhA
MHKIIKLVIIGIVSIILLNSLYFAVMAVYKTVHAYILVVNSKMEERPGMHIAESLDGFMLALFFIIFAVGIAKLFLPAANFLNKYNLPWLKVENFSQLKYFMWEMLLTTVFVFFLIKLLTIENGLHWNLLIYPVSILLLALAYKLIKEEH